MFLAILTQRLEQRGQSLKFEIKKLSSLRLKLKVSELTMVLQCAYSGVTKVILCALLFYDPKSFWIKCLEDDTVTVEGCHGHSYYPECYSPCESSILLFNLQLDPWSVCWCSSDEVLAETKAPQHFLPPHTLHFRLQYCEWACSHYRCAILRNMRIIKPLQLLTVLTLVASLFVIAIAGLCCESLFWKLLHKNNYAKVRELGLYQKMHKL